MKIYKDTVSSAVSINFQEKFHTFVLYLATHAWLKDNKIFLVIQESLFIGTISQ